MVCQQCDHEASSDHAFCSYCGAPLAGSAPPAYTGQSYQGNAAPETGQPYQAGPYPPYPGQPGQPYEGWTYPGSAYQRGPHDPYQGYGGPGAPGQYPPYPGGSAQYPPPPPGMPYGQPWQQANRSGTNRYSTIGIILGIISFFFLPIIFGPAGLIVSAMGRSRGERRANVALVVSALGLVFGVILGVLAFHEVYN
jgi:hypothetical protein